jgi:hypothetical protein
MGLNGGSGLCARRRAKSGADGGSDHHGLQTNLTLSDNAIGDGLAVRDPGG